ncbi:MAG: DoxX family protein [Chitinophagaceae bacterium]|nr:DoxX family protein [Chitinophagaceae bacterium]
MRKLFSTRYNPAAFNTALLVLRLGFGILLAHHGYLKISNFQQTQGYMMDFMGIGKSATAALVIFTELFCGSLIIIGLFTRLACIPIIIMFVVIIFKVGHADFFGKEELPIAYIIPFIALLFTGAGKISVDNMISK